MRKPRTETIDSSSPEETLSLAARLAGELPPGSVVALLGPLGSGKTVFVKGLARGLGLASREATSPTYTLIHEHEGPRPLYHVDLYRLETRAEVAELGLEEYCAREGIVAIEWAEKADFLPPESTMTVEFEILGPRGRRITITRGRGLAR